MVHQEYGVDVTKASTISKLAYNIFMQNYYNNNIALLTNKDMWSSIKSAYYGGIAEVYKPYGENLYYYDVNYLYPYVALNDLPGLDCKYHEYIKDKVNPEDIFGYYYCKVKSSNSYLGLLPIRTRDGSVILPNGSWEGWYFSEEIKFASQNGYQISIERGYIFTRESNVFTNYVTDLYKNKVESKDNVQRSVSKSLLNNLIGRFGMTIDKPITCIVNDELLDRIDSTREVNSVISIADNSNLVNLNPIVNKDICEEFNVDYVSALNEVFNINVLDKPSKFKDVNIAISVAVNSYARVYMAKLKLELLNKGYNIYYSDTDSIVTDKMLDDNLVGKDIGKFKLEYTIKRGYFISSKMYCLVLDNNDIVIKFKSGDSKSLNNPC